MNKLIKKIKGWYWPKNDGDGDIEGKTSCWTYMQVHPDTPRLISNYVPEKRIVVQAGGNCGFYVKQYAELFEIVYTFEPEPVNFYCLNLNVTEHNVLKFQGCLGDEHRCVGLNKFMPDVGSTHVSGEGSVPTFLIDDLNLSACDLIHLDVEGYELKALKGAVETIKKFKPVIAFECHDAWAGRYESNLTQIENFIGGLGYSHRGTEHGDKVYKFGD
jgi:FkbM family methyltransferase